MAVTLHPVREIPLKRTQIASENEYFEQKKTTDIVDPDRLITRPNSGVSFSIYYAEDEVYITYGGSPYKVEGISEEVVIPMVRRGLQSQIGRIEEAIEAEYKSLEARLKTKHRMLDRFMEEDERLRSIMLSTMSG